MPDLNLREWATIAPLIAVIVWIGFYPQPLLSTMKEPVDAFVQRVSKPSPARRAEAPLLQPAPSLVPGTAPHVFMPPGAPMARPPEQGKSP